MRKFEGNINGKIYTNEKEFDKALLQMDDNGDVCVSYRYVSIPDVNDEPKLKSVDSNNESVKNYVSENEYVKNIADKTDNLTSNKEKVIENVQNLSAISEENYASNEEVSANVGEIIEEVNLVNENCAKMNHMAQELDESVAYFHN